MSPATALLRQIEIPFVSSTPVVHGGPTAAGADGEAAALEPDEPARTCGGAAAEPVGYQCCHDCGVREPCDRHCPYEQAMERYRARLNRARSGDSRFELDPAAFMSEIEPVPAFLTDNRAEQIEEMLELARAEDWPAPRRMAG